MGVRVPSSLRIMTLCLDEKFMDFTGVHPAAAACAAQLVIDGAAKTSAGAANNSAIAIGFFAMVPIDYARSLLRWIRRTEEFISKDRFVILTHGDLWTLLPVAPGEKTQP